MNNTKKHIRLMLVIFCVLFVILCGYLLYVIEAYGTRWFTNPYNSRLSAQKNAVEAGSILDRNQRVLAGVDADGERTYSKNQSVRLATAHVVGDNYGQTFGAETFFAKYILGFDQSLFERIAEMLSGQKKKGSDVELTIDSDLCEYIYEAMGDYKGAVVVMNYKTGEILASVSKPTFDPSLMEEYLSGDREMDSSAMVNRATMGRYPPGSTFKIVTLIAALRYLPDIENRTFTCDGPLVFDAKTGDYLSDVHFTQEEDIEIKAAAKAASEAAETKTESEDATEPEAQTESEATPEPETETAGESASSEEQEIWEKYSFLRDYQSEYHGEITLKQALQKSCNHVFAQLAMEIGSTRMRKVAKELGFNEDFLFDDMVVYASSYESSDTDYALAWSGVGQSTDLITPVHSCMITAAIANDGVMMEPKLLHRVISPRSTVTKSLTTKVYSTNLSAYELETVREYMLSVVTSGTGRNVRIDGLEVGGKTGTAETSSDKNVKAHAWFTGFVYSDDHPIAITVVLEKGGSGGSVAGPVAQKILKRAIKLGY